MSKTRVIVALLSLLPLLSQCGRGAAIQRIVRDVHTDRALQFSANRLRLVVEPSAGEGPVVQALNRAARTVFMEMYILTDRRIIRALERAAAQGVKVYVLLEHHPLGLGPQPERAANALRAAGVFVRWARPDVTLTHAKFLVIDDRVAIIGTANLSRSAFSHNREFLVLDQREQDVREASNLFRADWDRRPARLGDPDLVVAPSNARSKLTALMYSASRDIRIYAEEVNDPKLEVALEVLRRRGIRVEVMLPRGPTPGGAALAGSGVEVRESSSPYIHAKAVLVDGRRAFIGSENISSTSLDRNRELGVLIGGPIVTSIERIFAADWRRAVALREAVGARHRVRRTG